MEGAAVEAAVEGAAAEAALVVWAALDGAAAKAEAVPVVGWRRPALLLLVATSHGAAAGVWHAVTVGRGAALEGAAAELALVVQCCAAIEGPAAKVEAVPVVAVAWRCEALSVVAVWRRPARASAAAAPHRAVAARAAAAPQHAAARRPVLEGEAQEAGAAGWRPAQKMK